MKYRKLLGDLGENLVLEYERKRLHDVGLIDLANKVKHVSAEEGDGAGYDILSFEENGEKKFIEVKTTRGSVRSDFYISANEVEFSKNHADNFYLYHCRSYLPFNS